MLIFPSGNKQNFLAVYLDAPEAAYTPQHMSPNATFKLTLVNHLDPSKSHHKGQCGKMTYTRTDFWTVICRNGESMADVVLGVQLLKAKGQARPHFLGHQAALSQQSAQTVVSSQKTM